MLGTAAQHLDQAGADALRHAGTVTHRRVIGRVLVELAWNPMRCKGGVRGGGGATGLAEPARQGRGAIDLRQGAVESAG